VIAMLNEKMLKTCMEQVEAEIRRAREKYPPMVSQHEGIAIIREEYLELERLVFWEKDTHVKTWDGSREACQIAAMGVCFMMEACTADKCH